jgi:oxygen-independent coproporphyrinogen-3 oxidase
MTTGLYVHIPFCQKKCGYCDFYSVTDMKNLQRFTDALIREIQLTAAQYPNHIYDTLYLGGGTPSILPIDLFAKIWQALHDSMRISGEGEFTIEANPGTLNRKNLSFYKEIGINRLSLGVQSFHDDDLHFLARIHSYKDALDSFFLAREIGFHNINIDLMTAFPGLSPNRFQKTLEMAVKLNSEHISCYTLIFEKGTPFYARMKKGELTALDADQEADYYEMANAILSGAGYQAYEVSNFAKDRRYFSCHNLKYWGHQPYIGLGPSAHSFLTPVRWYNVKNLEKYLIFLEQNHLPIVKRENLKTGTLEFEYIFLNLRLKEGINLGEFKNIFKKDFQEVYTSQLKNLESSGMIEKSGNHIRLSSKGWLLADEIASIF